MDLVTCDMKTCNTESLGPELFLQTNMFEKFV